MPGDADLTAHVDFAALMAAAAAGGADIHGPLSQGMFLGRLGIEARTEKLCDGAGPAQREALETGCRRLI
ncbi:MAG: class I SAM-dependent methyltransferase, partial [Rhodospirillales bacterium]|nr:class I SAM-dependent methyltransferase [Rhodospirillales bacterium]